jgi:hypothetical protein
MIYMTKNIKLHYKLVNINHIRGYSINKYLNFNLSYKLTIDHIPVVYRGSHHDGPRMQSSTPGEKCPW